MDAGRVFLRCLVPLSLLVASGGDGLEAQERGTGRWSVSHQPPDVTVAFGYGADGFLLANGGVSDDSFVYDNIDLLLHLNLKALPGLRGTSIRVHVHSTFFGQQGSGAGVFQQTSSLEATEEWRLYEAWVQHQIRTPHLSVLAGIYDINSEFDVIPSAGDFLNSSFGFGPEYGTNGVTGPSTFPSTGLAARVMFQPTRSLYGLVGVSDAVPGDGGDGGTHLDGDEGALFSFEVGWARLLSDVVPLLNPRGLPAGEWRGRPGPRRRRIGRGRPIEDVRFKIALGGWVYSSRFQRWTPGEPEGRSWGIYLLGETLLHQDAAGSRKLSGFARVGTAAEEVNRVDLSLKGGLALSGGVPGRPDDITGLAFAFARNGSPYLEDGNRGGFPLDRGETVVELTYRASLGSLLTLQPDLQFVVNPGMRPEKKNVLFLGLRGNLLLELNAGGTPPV
jgi:porin